MAYFASTASITPEALRCIQQIGYWLNQCQQNGINARAADFYDNGRKHSAIILDGIEIKDDKTNSETNSN